MLEWYDYMNLMSSSSSLEFSSQNCELWSNWVNVQLNIKTFSGPYFISSRFSFTIMYIIKYLVIN